MVAKELTDKELADKHTDLLLDFDAIQVVQKDERDQCLQDRRFATIPKAMWEDELQDQYAKRLKLEFNKVWSAVKRIVNEYRNNRITVDFVPRDGSQSEELSDFCDGLLRSNEVDCNANEAYDNAFEEAVLGGIGAWRYSTKYVDELDPECEEQEIVIEPIFDADISVFFDLGAKRQDKSDARRCFVISSFTHEAFEDRFGYSADEAKPPSIESASGDYNFDWVKPDVVYVAEVYEVEEKQTKVHIYDLPNGVSKTIYDEDLDTVEKQFLSSVQANKRKSRSVKQRKIRKYIMAGDRILEDCGHIAGDSIPVVMNFGQRWFIQNIERAMGHVRLTKDPQRIFNMLVSGLGEMVSKYREEKPIFLSEQIQAHAEAWGNDNVEDYAYLTIDPAFDAEGNKVITGPVGVKPVPNVPPALAALIGQTQNDLDEILGLQQDGETLNGNISTQTAMLVQQRVDMQTFIYMDNFAKAMKRGGEIWLGIAKDVYTEKNRGVKTINKRNKVAQSFIKRPMMDDHGSNYLENDLTKAKMSVVAEIGPSSSTANQAIIHNLTNLLTNAVTPEDQSALIASIIYHTDGEGLDDLRDFYRKKLLAMGIAKPTKEEQAQIEQESANAQPDPTEMLARAMAENEISQAAENQADVIVKQAQANKTNLESAQIAQEIDQSKQNQVLDLMQALGPQITPPDVTGVTIE